MKPKLYVFAISHYCEKARWALDYLQVDYQLLYLSPISHFKKAKQLGVPGSSLPILETGEKVIQGSSDIIDWAETQSRAKGLSYTLVPECLDSEYLAMEQRLDEKLGVHVRRWYYSEALVEHPTTVRSVFTKDLGLIPKILLSLAWPKVRQKMIKLMDLGFDQGLESQAIVEAEVDWLDSLLSDGRPFLGGDAFSRIDLTAASLLGPILRERDHEVTQTAVLPPRLSGHVRQWAGRPIVSLINKLYQDFR
jgi:glutathione S-transferase